MTQRTERVDELLRQEIGSIVAREIADPRVGFATITKVETDRELRHAKVWVSVIGQPKERTETISALTHAMPFVRHQLGERLRIKRIPMLHVVVDDTAERGTRILQLIDELSVGLVPEGEPSKGESLPTPVPRLPHEGDLTDEPSNAVIPPKPRKRRTYGRATQRGKR